MSWKTLPVILVMLEFSHAIYNNTNKTNSALMIAVERQIAKSVASSLSKYDNTSIRVSGFEARDGLKKFIDAASETVFNGSKSEMLVSFLADHAESMLQTIAYSQKMDFLAFQARDCQMSLYHKEEKLACKHYPKQYLDAVESVIAFFRFKKIVIITSKKSCRKTFADGLYKVIYQYQQTSKDNTQNLLLIMKYEFDSDAMDTREINDIMYSIKFLDTSLVILVCENEVTEVLFKVATKYAMLSFYRVWMVFDYVESDKVRPMPLQIINVIDDRTNNVAWGEQQIANMSLVAARAQTAQYNVGGFNNPTNKRKSLFTSLSTAFIKTKCPSSSQGSVNIRHRLAPGQWTNIFNYNKQSGVVLPFKDTQFHKIFAPSGPKSLKVVTILDEPFTSVAHHLYKKNAWQEYFCERGVPCRVPVKADNGTIWNSTCCIGHSMDVLELLSRDLHFKPKLYVVEDGYYGSLVGGKWVGMIGDLVDKKADIAMAGLTINNIRSKVVDFSPAFMQVELGILLSSETHQKSVLNFSFLDYITENLLWCILGVFITGLVLVYCFDNNQLFCQIKSKLNSEVTRKQAKETRYSWKEGFTYFSGLTFQRDLGGKNPTQYGAQVTAVVFAFAMVVTMTAYTAVLTASSVQQEERHPFLGLKDDRVGVIYSLIQMRKPTNSFRFGTVSATNTETFFRNVPDPTYHKMYLFMKKYNVESTVDGAEKIINGELEGFVDEKPFLQYYVSKQRQCLLQIVGLSISHVSYGLALQKKSPWTQMIANSILKYEISGKLLEIDKKWLSSGCSSGTGSHGVHQYSAQYFSGLFVILSSAFVIAFLVLVCEHLYHRYHKRVKNPFEIIVKKRREARQMDFSLHGDLAGPSQNEENNDVSPQNHSLDQWRLSNQL